MSITIFRDRVLDVAASQLMAINGLIALLGNRGLMRVDGGMIHLKYKGKTLRFVYSWALGFAPYPLAEIFVKEAYRALDVKGNVVIDIGASIADSPIYFALNGAKEVYGFETDGARYKASIENIRLNNIQNCFLYNREFDLSRDGHLLDGSVMKVDCEGCEYGLIGSPELSRLDGIILEFHRGERGLADVLSKNGFEVRTVRGSGKRLGMIHALRTKLAK